MNMVNIYLRAPVCRSVKLILMDSRARTPAQNIVTNLQYQVALGNRASVTNVQMTSTSGRTALAINLVHSDVHRASVTWIRESVMVVKWACGVMIANTPLLRMQQTGSAWTRTQAAQKLASKGSTQLSS